MPQTTSQQIYDLISRAKRPLITTQRNFSIDGLSAALALRLALKKINKNADIIIENFKIADNFKFLPEVDKVSTEVKTLQKCLINIDISQTGISALNYDIKGNNLRIHLTPVKGTFSPEDLKLTASEFYYDLILTVDTPELESLGKLYDYHRDLFYQIPVINIDHSLTNEQYGHINLVNVTAAATTEVIYQLINAWPEKLIDQDIATCLLAGLISKTKSFKTNQVTPLALQTASDLINFGANRKEIVTSLYQTKTITTLKLWGKVLSRLEADPEKRLIWSKLDLHDFTDSGASSGEAGGVIEELISLNPFAEVVVLFCQNKLNQTTVTLQTNSPRNAFSLVREFNPIGDKNRVDFTLSEDLNQAEKTVISSLKKQLAF